MADREIGVGPKVILFKYCGELSLLVKCKTCTFGPIQSCTFKTLKVSEIKVIIYHIIFGPFINAIQNGYRKYNKFLKSKLSNQSQPAKCQMLFEKMPIIGLC